MASRRKVFGLASPTSAAVDTMFREAIPALTSFPILSQVGKTGEAFAGQPAGWQYNTSVDARRKIRWTIVLLVLIISVGILIWGIWPAGVETQSIPIAPSDLGLPTPSGFRIQVRLFI